jgi:hypothetical protein
MKVAAVLSTALVLLISAGFGATRAQETMRSPAIAHAGTAVDAPSPAARAELPSAANEIPSSAAASQPSAAPPPDRTRAILAAILAARLSGGGRPFPNIPP